jgi:hypothetical protein
MENHLRIATIVANLLDNQFELFGHRFGLNGVLGLIPGAGDIVTAVFSMHLIWIGIKMEVPLLKLLQMIMNVLLNFFIGLIPLIGDYADFFHKANLKNLAILKEHAEKYLEGELVEEKR